MNNRKLITLITGVFISSFVFGQKTNIYTQEDAEFKTAIELFQKEKYGAAQKSFTNIIASHKDLHSLIRVDAEYYNAICASELFNKDGELFLKQFVIDHPESPKVKTAYFYLGQYNYRKKKYKDALNWFEKVDIYDLTTDELAEFYFKRGYSFFIENKFADAKKDFIEIKDVDNKYASAAKYYAAHIAYNEKNYEIALNDFIHLQKNETFGSVVPYYIAQIYYLQGQYEKVISFAPHLLDSSNTKRAPEIARIVGESYYRTNQYKDAIPYLKRYEKAANGLQRQDNYQLGYALYKTNDYANAVNYFIKVTDADDSLSQNASYHMGDCYLKTDKKQNAIAAFGKASKAEFDKAIQEDALYNYAKLCYELAYNPYNEAIKAFQRYIKDFPNSGKVDEAYTFLVNVFITSKSYKEALEAIEKIKTLTPELKQAYQKVAYYRGVDLFNNMEYEEAIKSFNKSQAYTFDKEITANAIYWKAESFYRLKKYKEAIESYTDYIDEPGAIGKSEISETNYNIGYSYYKLNDWENSILWFRKFVTFKPAAHAKKINDALNRIGDGYFMSREFSNAADYYEQSFKMKLINPDYALFQKAIADGVQKKYADKIADLKLFIQTYSSSSSTYNQKAKFELAQAYYTDSQMDLALAAFKKFIDDYPNSLYENTCLSKIGLIYYYKTDDDNALIYFDKLIKRDRTSSDAGVAIDIVKKIYTTKGNIEGLDMYLKSIGAAIPEASLDSLSFNIGKTNYLEHEYGKVITDFQKYISKYPNGIFILQANFFKAECEYSAGKTEDALVSYKFVISKPKSEFTEQSLSRAADIVFKKQDYKEALDYYKQLEQVAEDPKNNAAAKIGLMRCNFQLKNYADAKTSAKYVLGIDKSGKEMVNEAHYVTASCAYEMAASIHNTDTTKAEDPEKYDEALQEFQFVAENAKSEVGAEAKYNVANIQFLKKENKKSQKSIFELVNGEGDFPYWTDKAMILLSDNYLAMKDNFQAKETLKGVIKESDNAELIKLAKAKLDKIIADEEAAKKAKEIKEQPLNIQFEGSSPGQNKLYVEPTIKNDSTEFKKEE